VSARLLAALTAMMLVIGVAACVGKESPAVRVEIDKEFDRKLLDIVQAKGSARLHDLTTFSWDTTYWYYEGATAEEIEQDVGQPVLRSGQRNANAGGLAVFVQDGKVVRALATLELSFQSGHRYGPEVMVDGGKLVEP
jgi:hypothetical protein